MLLVMNYVTSMTTQCTKDVAKGNFKLLDKLHHFSSGVKALFTEFDYVGADELRQACEAAGFSLSSGIAYLW